MDISNKIIKSKTKVHESNEKTRKKKWIKIGLVGTAITFTAGLGIYSLIKGALSDSKNGLYPICKTCGSAMSIFDGWAWHTCPECGDSVRIIDGKEAWHKDIFKSGTKQLYTDFDLADLCRGGELKEE